MIPIRLCVETIGIFSYLTKKNLMMKSLYNFHGLRLEDFGRKMVDMGCDFGIIFQGNQISVIL
jgi:hypothetical protein